MTVTPITNSTELRSAVILLNAHALKMCNDTSSESLVENFTVAKDLLIEIYKYQAGIVNTPQSE